MVRRFVRRRPRYHSRRLKTIKWSVENFISKFDIGSDTTRTQPILPPITTLGVRKIKNITISINVSSPIAFAVVFVPEGTAAGPLNVNYNAMVSAYEPNQNVLMKGFVLNGPTRNFFSRLSRNLNSGDTICLILNNPYQTEEDVETFVTISYAIAFN